MTPLPPPFGTFPKIHHFWRCHPSLSHTLLWDLRTSLSIEHLTTRIPNSSYWTSFLSQKPTTFWISLRLFLDFSVISLMHYPIIAPFHGSHTYKLGPLASSLLHISAKTLFFDEYTSRKLCEFIFRQNTNVSETKTLYRSLWTFRRPQVVTFFRYQEWTT